MKTFTDGKRASRCHRLGALLFSSSIAAAGCASGWASHAPSPDLAAALSPGKWIKVDSETLAFIGIIGQDSARPLHELFTAGIKRVAVNSGGGDVTAAIAIANEIAARRLELNVKGYCLSSCANYWTVAAARTTLDNGIVGFHGNISSCVSLHGGVSRYVAKDLPGNPDAERVREISGLVAQSLEDESAFYAQRQLDRFAHERFCRPDKGLQDQHVYSFIAPSRSRLSAMGVTDLQGEQSVARLAEFNAWSNAPMLLESP
jgi:hypothetical protein